MNPDCQLMDVDVLTDRNSLRQLLEVCQGSQVQCCCKALEDRPTPFEAGLVLYIDGEGVWRKNSGSSVSKSMRCNELHGCIRVAYLSARNIHPRVMHFVEYMSNPTILSKSYLKARSPSHKNLRSNKYSKHTVFLHAVALILDQHRSRLLPVYSSAAKSPSRGFHPMAMRSFCCAPDDVYEVSGALAARVCPFSLVSNCIALDKGFRDTENVILGAEARRSGVSSSVWFSGPVELLRELSAGVPERRWGRVRETEEREWRWWQEDAAVGR
jgi:hypothetical protein